ncbi:MAG: MopE-related protein [Myxococcota bacterium]
MHVRTVALLSLVACNEAPGSPTVAISPTTPTTLDALEAVVQGEAADGNGDAVTYRYAWFVDGAPADASGTTVSADLTTKGETWKVVVTPSDGKLDGAVGEAEVTIADTPPTVSLAIDPLAPVAGEEVVATATAADVDDDEVAVSWSWSRDGAPAGLAEATLPAGVTARGEVWEVTATPDDGELDGEPAAVAFTVANAPPSLGGLTLAPEDATVSDTLTLSFQDPGDADGDDVVVSVAWYVDGVEVAGEEVGADDVASLAGLFAKGQSVWAVATPSDGYDDGEPVTAEAIVVADTPPVATGAYVSPADVYVDSVVTCVGEGWSDADGDAEGWLTTWTVGGGFVSNEDVLPVGTFARDEVVGCLLAPWDGELAGAPVLAAEVTVLNSPPACASTGLTIGPDPATLADALAVVTDDYGGCGDADGDALTRVHTWRADGVAVGTGDTLPAGLATRGQTVTLEVGYTDGIELAALSTSNAVTIVNAPPEVTSLTLSPSTVTAADTLTAAVTTSDAEGDAVSLTYAWTIDGVAAGTGLSLDGFVRGQTVAFTATPNDGYDDGVAVSASVVVANTPPGAPTVEISPARPDDGDDLVCVVSGAAADIDGDAVAYTFAWSVGGVSWPGATMTTFPGDTVPASATVVDQAWTCSVTAHDGTDGGDAGTATATVGCDLDEDGYEALSCGGADCDDEDDAIHPAASEVCDAADVDEDCDGLADEADDSLTGATWYRDADSDTYGDPATTLAACSRPTGYVDDDADCDDANNAVHPGGTERCDSRDADEDCDGLADDADPSVTGTVSMWPDADGDAYGDESAATAARCAGASGYVQDRADCDDGDDTISPGDPEVCGDGIDNDCDGGSGTCGISGSMDFDDRHARVGNSSDSYLAARFTTGDWDGDGNADLAMSAYYVNKAYVFYGPITADTSTSAADVTYTGSTSLSSMIRSLGDLDGDGDDELFVNDAASTASAFVLAGGTLSSRALTSADRFTYNTYSISGGAAGDMDGDGLDDFVIAKTGYLSAFSTDTLYVYAGDPSGTYTSLAAFNESSGDFGTVVDGGEDLDGDGLDDLIANANGHSGNPAGLYAILGDTALAGDTYSVTSDAWVVGSANEAGEGCLAGDVNGDGYGDVGWYGNTSRFGLFLGPPSSGRTLTADAYATTTNARTCVAGDFDDDGADDLAVLGSYYAYVWGTVPSGTLSNPDGSIYLGGSPGYDLEAADMDADGVDDLLPAYSSSGGYVYIFTGGSM